jgi:hypothetical protein
MNAHALISRLELLPAVLPPLLTSIDGGDARWKPPSGAWSILEVVNHLLDEETRDFRSRLESTLTDPRKPWPPNDPEQWARDGRYNERDLTDSVAKLVAERGNSLQWLRWLRNPDWSAAYHHPKAGPVTAGSLLASWAAHDALHLRQIAKRLYEMSVRDGGVYSVAYAGEWHA